MAHFYTSDTNTSENRKKRIIKELKFCAKRQNLRKYQKKVYKHRKMYYNNCTITSEDEIYSFLGVKNEKVFE